MKKLFMIAVAAVAVSCGNKQQTLQSENDSLVVATEVPEQETDTKDVEDKTVEKIQDFYKNYVFGEEEVTDEVVNKYCTKKLSKKLKDDYEYEGGGYAIWDFRSDAQDGPSDVQEVTNIESLGNGVYKVQYNDMGHKGFCNITVVVEGGNILFDKISK